MADWPKKKKHFEQWAKLMIEQATMPDRLSYSTAQKKQRGKSSPSRTGSSTRWRKRRSRGGRRRKSRQSFQE